MELVGLTLENFKRFASAHFEFCPGINIFCGPNESGKTTVHEALYTAIFGRERGQAVENWDGGVCSASLTYRSGGETWVLTRKLSESGCSLGTLSSDGELIDVVTDKDAVAASVADHLGISQRSVFDNTVSVRQLEISRLNTANLATIGNEIQRVLSGTEQTSASEAVRKLKRAQQDIMGKARPTKPREYETVTGRLQTLANEVAQVRQIRVHIDSLKAEQEQLESRIEIDADRTRVLSELLDKHKLWSDLRNRAAEIDKLHSETYATLKRLKELIDELSQTHRQLEDYSDLIGKADEIADNLTKLEGRRTELDARLWELEKAAQDAPGTSTGGRAVLWLASGALLAVAGLAAGFLIDLRLLLLLIPAALLTIRYVQIHGSNSSGGQAQLTQLSDSARNELNQVEAEEAAILSYMKCPNAARAWARIKAYRALAARAHEYEISLKASLNSRSMDDWDRQETDLGKELSALNRQLAEEFPAYSPTTEETEGWRAEFQILQQRLPASQARLHEVRGELEAEGRNARDLAALEGELEFLHGRKRDLEFLHKAYGEAITALETVTQDVSAEYMPVLRERATACIDDITDGRYTSVDINPDWQVTLDCTDHSGVATEALSAGTLDQLYFALRLACGELLSAGRSLPVILDDPFVNCDHERLNNVLGMLADVASRCQIVMMTHDRHILDWAQGLQAEGKVPCIVRELTT